MYVCMYVYIYICIYICMYVYIYIYIYIYIHSPHHEEVRFLCGSSAVATGGDCGSLFVWEVANIYIYIYI